MVHFFLYIHFWFCNSNRINKGVPNVPLQAELGIHRDTRPREIYMPFFIRLAYRGSNRENNRGDSSNIAVSSLPSRASRAISLFHFVNLQWREPFSKSNISSRDDSNVQSSCFDILLYSALCFYWLVINIFVRKLVSYI